MLFSEVTKLWYHEDDVCCYSIDVPLFSHRTIAMMPWCRAGGVRRICPAFCSSSVMWASFGTWPCKAFSKACGASRVCRMSLNVCWVYCPARYWEGEKSCGYGWTVMNPFFLGLNIHESQLFWCENQGILWLLTHHHVLNAWRLAPPLYKDALGDLQRLYLPRDFRGAFCGVSTGRGWQWWMWWFIMMWWAY